MINENFVILGILIMFLGDVSYFLDTLKGKIKPNKVSFLLWSLAPIIAFIAEINQGVGLQSVMTLSIGLATLTIFAASFVNKKAEWRLGPFDYICGGLSFLGLILWYLTKVGNIAIFFAILSDGLAGIPTLVKSYRFPETENANAYLATGINGGITLLTIKFWSFANFGFPLYTLAINIIFTLLIKFKLGKILS